MASSKDPEPGGGIRNTKTTHAFRVINFELFAKPVSFITNSEIVFVLVYVYACSGLRLSGHFTTEQDGDDDWSNRDHTEPGIHRVSEHLSQPPRHTVLKTWSRRTKHFKKDKMGRLEVAAS